MTYVKLEEDEEKAIQGILDSIDSEERLYRPFQLRQYKQSELYWEGLTGLDIFWSEVDQDWRRIVYETGDDGYPLDDPARNVNIYRAHGESIIAALTSSVPYNRYDPEDPDNPDDISTAKAFSTISELIQRHNDIPLKLIKAVYTLFNQGIVFGYNYSHKDREYGTYQTPIMEMVEEEKTYEMCPDCGSDISETLLPVENQVMDIATGLPSGPASQHFCPGCSMDAGMPIPVEQPLVQTYTEPKLVVSNYEDNAKTREIIEIWGPLNVRFPINVLDQKSAGYLILEMELHYALVRSLYPDKRKDINPDGPLDEYEAYARRDVNNPNEHNRNLGTLRRVWFRPWMFEELEDELRDRLTEKFPSGAYCVFWNDVYLESHDEGMDDHWTVTENPLSRMIHASPLGKQLLDIQDLTTMVVNLTAQTIEHGVPQTFADPKHLDFDAYGKQRVRPGDVYPLKSLPSGGGADQVFHTVKTATLSNEVDEFINRLDQYGQFVSGDFPSIFGGQQQGGSKTLGEYESSRAAAMQRLNLIWKMVTSWYAKMEGKTVKSYADSLRSEERDDFSVSKNGASYLKTWVKVDDLKGRVGEVVPESSEQFPTSWPQKVARFFELLQYNNPTIMAMLFTPANASFIKNIIGIDDLNMPGEDQRDKQLEEIFELLKGQPIPGAVVLDEMGNPILDPNTGMPAVGPEQPSIPIEPDVDEPVVHIEVTKAFLVSDYGRAIKLINPAGYANVVAHLRMHGMMMQQQQMQQAEQQAMMGEEGQEDGQSGNSRPASQAI